MSNHLSEVYKRSLSIKRHPTRSQRDGIEIHYCIPLIYSGEMKAGNDRVLHLSYQHSQSDPLLHHASEESCNIFGPPT